MILFKATWTKPDGMVGRVFVKGEDFGEALAAAEESFRGGIGGGWNHGEVTIEGLCELDDVRGPENGKLTSGKGLIQ